MKLDLKETNKERFLFSALSYQNEIILPDFQEKIQKDWVEYGDNNLFPDELLNLFNKSGIHNAIIESKVRMMCGDGIVQDIEDDSEWSDLTQNFIDQPNPYDSLNDIFKKVSMDYELYGLSYLEIKWNKTRTKIAQIYHIDASKVRWGKKNKMNRLETLFYSKDWSNYRKELYKPIELNVYGTSNKLTEVLPIIRYTPGLNYYSFPDYIAGTKWISIDTEISNFHFNNLKNGMSPSIFFGFPVGDTTNEERQMIESKIAEKYSGTNNSGKFILAFYDAEGDKKPEIQIMEQTNADKQYDLLNRTTLQQILIAHKITNENLVGISTPGKLGSAKELLDSYELYFSNVVEPEQKVILAEFKKLFLVNGFNDILIVENKPLKEGLSESILQNILTRDELREIIGYRPIDVEKVEENDGEIDTIDDKTDEKEVDFAGVRTITRENAREKIKDIDDNDLYIWKMTDNESCPSCKGFNGRTNTLKGWLNICIPGIENNYNFGNDKRSNYPHNPYGSYCESDCKCKLVKVGRSK